MSADPLPPDQRLTSVPQGGYQGGPEMTLLEHLKELRNRVLVSAGVLVLMTLVSFYFWETILGWLLAPGRSQIHDFRVSSFSPVDRISIVFKIGLYGGLILSSPVLIYEALAFIVPGLTPRERRMIAPGMIGVVFFLCVGMAFAYWVILPNSLGFLLTIGQDEIQNVTGIKEYVDFVTRIVFWVGISFEMPMVMALAARLGLVRARQLLKFWRYAVVLIFIVAAVITPTPDPFNQTLVGAPLLFLYFIGVGLAWVVQPKKKPIQEPV